MKAREYYEKYGDRIILKDLTAISEVVDDFMTDFWELVKIRHISSKKSLTNTINEVNNKWNVFCKMFPTPILNPDMLKIYLCRELGIRPCPEKPKNNFLL